MDTQSFLNSVASPAPGQNIRRKIQPLFDTVAIATGQTTYNPFTTPTGNIFLRNKQFPLSGMEIFAITNIALDLQNFPINTTAKATSLLELLQKSYLEIMVDSKQELKVPLLEVLSFELDPTAGTTTTATVGVKYVKRSKDLIIPILLNSNSNVTVNLVVSSTAATDFNGQNIMVTFNGIMSDKLDSFFLNLVGNRRFQELATTLYETQAISTTNQNTYSLFNTPTAAQNLFSGTLPLSSTERIEVQAIELFFPGAVNETLAAILNSRETNILEIKVDSVVYMNSNIRDMLSTATAQDQTFKDTGGTITDAFIDLNVVYANKVLEIPLIIPANANVTVNLTQPGSSTNSGRYFTALFKGKKTRQVS